MRANIDKKYLWRLGLLALAFLGISGWFLYDGTVTYPRQRERALAYEKLEEEDRLDEWRELATKNGWPTKDPGEPKKEVEIYSQLIIAAIAVIPGLLYAVFYLRARGRWIEIDDNGLRASNGRQLEFGQIVALDKKKWNDKGIARVHYRQNGSKRRLVLDDWKYEAEPTRAILRKVESHIDLSLIVRGAPEPPEEELPPEEVASDEAPPEEAPTEEVASEEDRTADNEAK